MILRERPSGGSCFSQSLADSATAPRENTAAKRACGTRACIRRPEDNSFAAGFFETSTRGRVGVAWFWFLGGDGMWRVEVKVVGVDVFARRRCRM